MPLSTHQDRQKISLLHIVLWAISIGLCQCVFATRLHGKNATSYIKVSEQYVREHKAFFVGLALATVTAARNPQYKSVTFSISLLGMLIGCLIGISLLPKQVTYAGRKYSKVRWAIVEFGLGFFYALLGGMLVAFCIRGQVK